MEAAAWQEALGVSRAADVTPPPPPVAHHIRSRGLAPSPIRPNYLKLSPHRCSGALLVQDEDGAASIHLEHAHKSLRQTP